VTSCHHHWGPTLQHDWILLIGTQKEEGEEERKLYTEGGGERV
jgi:hypothetical protein